MVWPSGRPTRRTTTLVAAVAAAAAVADSSNRVCTGPASTSPVRRYPSSGRPDQSYGMTGGATCRGPIARLRLPWTSTSARRRVRTCFLPATRLPCPSLDWRRPWKAYSPALPLGVVALRTLSTTSFFRGTTAPSTSSASTGCSCSMSHFPKTSKHTRTRATSSSTARRSGSASSARIESPRHCWKSCFRKGTRPGLGEGFTTAPTPHTPTTRVFASTRCHTFICRLGITTLRTTERTDERSRIRYCRA
mmetsp:Transcript_13483/g.43008  ORF Transcript_13483/g.43008 Transcript_13483/m.43008 type:complete len:249 (+) Transcript_13483:982-1728(+)